MVSNIECYIANATSFDYLSTWVPHPWSMKAALMHTHRNKLVFNLRCISGIMASIALSLFSRWITKCHLLVKDRSATACTCSPCNILFLVDCIHPTALDGDHARISGL